MIWGLSESAFTTLHVVLSLIGIASGLVVLGGFMRGRVLGGWTELFLLTTVATSVTGFGFPFDRLLPAHKVGLVSLVVLAVALLARYPLRLAGVWRRVFVVSSAIALYLNAFIGVVQAFQKFPVLLAAAPNQTEAPFVVAQLALLGLIAALTTVAVKRAHSGN